MADHLRFLCDFDVPRVDLTLFIGLELLLPDDLGLLLHRVILEMSRLHVDGRASLRLWDHPAIAPLNHPTVSRGTTVGLETAELGEKPAALGCARAVLPLQLWLLDRGATGCSLAIGAELFMTGSNSVLLDKLMSFRADDREGALIDYLLVGVRFLFFRAYPSHSFVTARHIFGFNLLDF